MKTKSGIYGFALCPVLLSGLVISTACGGGSSSSPPPPPATLASISLAPQNATLSAAVTSGLTQQFTATGIFSDQSTRNLTTGVNWTSSSTAVASMGMTTGLATAVSTGTTTIKASDPSSGLSGSTTLTVTNVVGFTATGSMSTARDQHTATLLMDGTVLIAGGMRPFDFTGCGKGYRCSLNSAELFDQNRGVFTAVSGIMTTARQNHGAVSLPSGKVLIVGGHQCLSELG